MSEQTKTEAPAARLTKAAIAKNGLSKIEEAQAQGQVIVDLLQGVEINPKDFGVISGQRILNQKQFPDVELDTLNEKGVANIIETGYLNRVLTKNSPELITKIEELNASNKEKNVEIKEVRFAEIVELAKKPGVLENANKILAHENGLNETDPEKRTDPKEKPVTIEEYKDAIQLLSTEQGNSYRTANGQTRRETKIKGLVYPIFKEVNGKEDDLSKSIIANATVAMDNFKDWKTKNAKNKQTEYKLKNAIKYSKGEKLNESALKSMTLTKTIGEETKSYKMFDSKTKKLTENAKNLLSEMKYSTSIKKLVSELKELDNNRVKGVEM